MGTENIEVKRMQTILKTLNAATETTAFIYGKSTANQRIESWWGILRKYNSQFWMNLFQQLKEDNHFNGSALDKSLVQFCFMKIIQVSTYYVGYFNRTMKYYYNYVLVGLHGELVHNLK